MLHESIRDCVVRISKEDGWAEGMKEGQFKGRSEGFFEGHDKCVAEGKAWGMEIGRRQGFQHGHLQGQREMFERVANLYFGSLGISATLRLHHATQAELNRWSLYFLLFSEFDNLIEETDKDGKQERKERRQRSQARLSGGASEQADKRKKSKYRARNSHS